MANKDDRKGAPPDSLAHVPVVDMTKLLDPEQKKGISPFLKIQAGCGIRRGTPRVARIARRSHPSRTEELVEIPRNQRYLSRPKLKVLFEGKLTKTKRDARIVQAVHRHGYTQREVADFLDLHYATVSRLANRL